MRIKTTFWPKPIPVTSRDWSAIDEDTYDGAPDSKTRHQIGFGRTEAEAVKDLMEKLAEAQ